jgi:Zn-finger nucleic acid-binding protein
MTVPSYRPQTTFINAVCYYESMQSKKQKDKTLDCPRCWVVMKKEEVDVLGPNVIIDSCPNCMDIWFDNKELKNRWLSCLPWRVAGLWRAGTIKGEIRSGLYRRQRGKSSRSVGRDDGKKAQESAEQLFWALDMSRRRSFSSDKNRCRRSKEGKSECTCFLNLKRKLDKY